MAAKSLATMFVNIVPGTKDFAAQVKQELGQKTEQAGQDAADGFGGKFNAGLKSVVISAGAIMAGLGIGRYLEDGVVKANELNGKLHEVVSLLGTTGSTADAQFKVFAGQVKNVSQELGIAQTTISSGLYEALSAGVPKDNVVDFLKVASKAAIAGVTDTNTAVDGLTTVINSFGLKAEDAGKIADSMFQTVNAGKTTFPELASFMYEVGPAAAAAKVSFQEVNAALATMTAQGIPTTVATGNIRAALVGLQRPSEDMDAIFTKLGYANAQTAIEAKGLGFALDAVKTASGGNNGELQRLLGSVEAVQAANVLAGTGAKFFKEQMVAQANATGVADKAFQEIDKGRNLERMNVAMENLTLSIGGALLPAVEGFMKVFTPVIDFMAANPVIVQILAGALAFLAAAFIGVTIATWAMNTALLANPITWIVLGIVAAIALLVGAVIAIVSNWDAIVKWIGEVFGPVFTWLGGIFTWLWESVIKPVVDFIAAAWNWLYNTIIQPIITLIVIYISIWAAIFTWLWETILAPIFKFIGDIFVWLYNTFIQPIIDNIVLAVKVWAAIFDWLYKNIIKPVFDGIAAVFNWIWKTIIEPVFNWIGAAVNTVGKIFTDIFGNVASFIQTTFNSIVGFVKAPINAIIDLINGMIDSLNKINIPIPDLLRPFVGGAKELKLSIPKIPRLAKGGYVDSPTTALIGEAGPEVVTPLKDFKQMMGLNGNGEKPTINYYAAPNQSLDAEQALTQALKRAKVLGAW